MPGWLANGTPCIYVISNKNEKNIKYLPNSFIVGCKINVRNDVRQPQSTSWHVVFIYNVCHLHGLQEPKYDAAFLLSFQILLRYWTVHISATDKVYGLKYGERGGRCRELLRSIYQRGMLQF
jgi:hypothetical protein